jgi:two-component system, sensor histidine kinase YesM
MARYLFKVSLEIVKNSFQNVSLMMKLTTAFIIAVLLPTTAIGFYTFNQTQIYARQEIVKNGRMTLLQMKDNINTKILFAKRISENIAYGSDIPSFLSKDYELTPESLEYYRSRIDPFIVNSRELEKENIDVIRVYFTNSSIPEAKSLLDIRRLDSQQWYKELDGNNRKDLWLYTRQIDPFSVSGNSLNRHVFMGVKKIYSIGDEFLGILTIDILQEKMLSTIDNYLKENGQAYVIDSVKNVIYPQKAVADEKEANILKKYISKEEGYFLSDGNLYIYDTISDLNIQLVTKIRLAEFIKKSRRINSRIIFTITFGVIALLVMIYFIIRNIFSKLKQFVDVMNRAAEGDFTLRIPVTRRDEIGQMGKDFNILIQKINDQIADILKKETAQKTAQLLALQYQINPHFIYNTLDVFRMKLVMKGEYEVSESLIDFGEILQYNLNDKSMFTTVECEIQNVVNYINIQKLRHDNTLSMKVYMPEEARNLNMIKFILQPIVENSIKYGFDDRDRNLLIEIKIILEEGNIKIIIRDNGAGIGAEELERLNYSFRFSEYAADKRSTGKGIGLSNINERLKLFYGNDYYIQMSSCENEYTETSIKIPCKREG